DGAFNIDALHYVTHTLTVGTGVDTFTLLPGDVLFSTAANETLISTNTLAVGQDDVVVFRPDHPDDSSSGTLTVLLNGLSALNGGNNVRDIALVEQDTPVGDVTLTAGTVLFARNGGAEDND